MVYDAAHGRVVLFGGYDGAKCLSDTWEWDGSNWSQRAPLSRPSARQALAMCYDSTRARTLMFGGFNGIAPLSDTWEWDGTNWSQRPSAAQPGARYASAMIYDDARRRAVVFGGANPSDTWEWDGIDWVWRVTNTTPSARQGGALAYDSRRARVLLFGGIYSGILDDTWDYGPAYPAGFVSFGAGCTGSAGVPMLGSDQGSLPWVGENYTARLSNLGASATLNRPFLLLGDSKTSWGAAPLPLDLTAIGMTGCVLYTNPLLTLTATNSAGAATWSLFLPNQPNLVGATLYAQGAVTSPGANGLGLVSSNACELRIGAK